MAELERWMSKIISVRVMMIGLCGQVSGHHSTFPPKIQPVCCREKYENWIILHCIAETNYTHKKQCCTRGWGWLVPGSRPDRTQWRLKATIIGDSSHCSLSHASFFSPSSTWLLCLLCPWLNFIWLTPPTPPKKTCQKVRYPTSLPLPHHPNFKHITFSSTPCRLRAQHRLWFIWEIMKLHKNVSCVITGPLKNCPAEDLERYGAPYRRGPHFAGRTGPPALPAPARPSTFVSGLPLCFFHCHPANWSPLYFRAN